MPDSKLIAAWNQHRRVSTDTRKIQPGDVFFALKGDNFNGNRFAAKALESGASYAVIDEAEYLVGGDARYILVANVLEALQALARHYRDQFDIPFIGITGTNGKTTTKELMHAVLSTEKRVHATVGNLNNHIGVPLTLLSMPEDTELAIIEMGANKHGDIHELCEIAHPTIGIITNIGYAHLERFGDIDGVEATKGEMFRYVGAHGGTAWINIGDVRVARAGSGVTPNIRYGSGGAYEIAEMELGEDRTDLQVRLPDGRSLALTSHLIGSHNAENILVAVIAGCEMGIAPAHIQKGIHDYVPRINRTQLVRTDDFLVLLDAYNANPSSMKATLHSVAAQQYGTTALILGDMFELGEASDELHADLVREVAAVLPEARLIGIGTAMQAAMDGNSGPGYRAYENVEAALPHIRADVAGVKFILLKGSRGMALEGLLPALGLDLKVH